MRRIVIARHAESETNVRELLNGDSTVDPGLTQLGREQARALGRATGPVDVVAHTEFARTRETAELAWPEAPRLVVPELNEISFGRFEGTRWADGYRDWASTTGPHDACPGGGESRADAIRRYARGYRALLERPEDTVALVAHGAHVRYVLLALEGSPPVPVLAGVEQARPVVLARDDYQRAVELIEAWAREPVWR
jgi:broad specificity phosphatase PhoE